MDSDVLVLARNALIKNWTQEKYDEFPIDILCIYVNDIQTGKAMLHHLCKISETQ